MSHEYAMSRVRDAIEKSEGNHLKAQRLILQWIEKDHTLLFGLVAPHMQGIIAHALNHAMTPPKKPMPKRIDTQAAAAQGEFGAALLSSLKGGASSEGFGFGQAQAKDISKPGKASKAHVDAINKLVSASSGKTDKKKK